MRRWRVGRRLVVLLSQRWHRLGLYRVLGHLFGYSVDRVQYYIGEVSQLILEGVEEKRLGPRLRQGQRKMEGLVEWCTWRTGVEIVFMYTRILQSKGPKQASTSPPLLSAEDYGLTRANLASTTSSTRSGL